MTLENIGCLIWLVETFAREHRFSKGIDGDREREMLSECRDIVNSLAAELPEPFETPADSKGIPY